jgi:hypothetical protein
MGREVLQTNDQLVEVGCHGSHVFQDWLMVLIST